MTNSEVTRKLDRLKETFAAGKYWNHTTEENDPSSVTNSPCNHHGTCDFYGHCACNNFDSAIQCHGFAKYMAKRVFNTYPSVTTSYNTESDGVDLGSGWKIYTSDHFSTITLEPGDIIRTNTHTAIVHSVDNGNVTVGEVLGSLNCKIAWGGFNNGSYTTVSEILNIANYVVKAPKNEISDV